jgi:hypothetical protein
MDAPFTNLTMESSDFKNVRFPIKAFWNYELIDTFRTKISVRYAFIQGRVTWQLPQVSIY